MALRSTPDAARHLGLTVNAFKIRASRRQIRPVEIDGNRVGWWSPEQLATLKPSYSRATPTRVVQAIRRAPTTDTLAVLAKRHKLDPSTVSLIRRGKRRVEK